MATESVLSREVVEIVSRGVERVEADIARVRGATDRIGEAAARAQAFVGRLGTAMVAAFRAPGAVLNTVYAGIRRMAERLQQLGGIARLFTFSGAFGIGALVTAAARGTVEGGQFAKAMEALARVVGNVFAPYVRFATAAVVDLAKWFQALSPETKANAAQWAIVATAVAGAVAVMPLVVTAISGVIGALTALASPFIAIPVLIAGTVAALLYLTAEGETFAEKMAGIAASIVGSWHLATNAVKAYMNQIMLTAMILDNLKKGNLVGAAGAMAAAQAAGLAEAKKLFAPDAEADKNKQKAREVVGDVGGGLAKFLDKARALWEGVSKAPFTPAFKAGFESSDQTINRLSEAINNMDTVDVQRQQLEEQKKINEKMNQLGNAFGKVADAIPAIR